MNHWLPRLATMALTALIPLLFSHPVLGQTSASVLPDTPAGRRATELLRLTVDGDEASIRAFLEGSVAPRFRDAFPI